MFTVTRQLDAKNKEYVEKMRTVLKSFTDMFGFQSISMSGILGKLPIEIIYSNEYIQEIYPLIHPKESYYLFDILFNEPGFANYGTARKMVEYISKNHKEDVLPIIDELGSERNPMYGNITYLSDVFHIISRFSRNTESDCQRDEIVEHVISSKLFEKYYVLCKAYATSYIDEYIMTSKNLENFVSVIKEKFPTYKNYPVILFNENIQRDDRIKFIKKTYVQKSLPAYMGIFQYKLKDFSLLDDFITAVVLENNRVSEKEAAIKNILERFFIGISNDETKCWNYNILLAIPGVIQFIKKYGKYLPIKYCSQKYTCQWNTRESANIVTYIKLYLDAMCSTDVERLDAVMDLKKELGDAQVQSIFSKLGNLNELSEKDIPILKRIIEYNSRRLDMPYNFFSSNIYRMIDRKSFDINDFISTGVNQSLLLLMNKYPELFDKCFNGTVYPLGKDFYRQFSYAGFLTNMNVFSSNYMVTPENSKWLFRLKIFTEKNMTNFFLDDALDSNNTPLKYGNEISFAKDYFNDMLSRIKKFSDSGNKEMLDFASQRMKDKLKVYSVDSSVQCAISAASNAIATKKSYPSFYSQGSIRNLNPIIDDVANIIEDIARLINLDETERTNIINNLEDIKTSTGLLFNV